MPIVNEIKGNIISLCEQGDYSIMVQGCNCLGIQGSGLAGQLRKYPEVLQADLNFCNPQTGDFIDFGEYRLGKYSVAVCETPERINFFVVNAYTQLAPATPEQHLNKTCVADYEAIERVFTALNADFIGSNSEIEDSQVAIPMLGAGLAYGDWDVISEIINRVTPDINIDLIIYDPLA